MPTYRHCLETFLPGVGVGKTWVGGGRGGEGRGREEKRSGRRGRDGEVGVEGVG